MVRVRYQRSGDTHRLDLCGHAGWAEIGKDIVCAGVSAITNALSEYLDREQFDAVIMLRCGNAHIACTGGSEVAAAFEMAVCGYNAIAEQYPQYVDVNIAHQG